MRAGLRIGTIAIAILVTACGGSQVVGDDGEPDWVMTGRCSENIKTLDPAKMFCGVGEHVIENRRQKSLAVEAATAKARASLARNLSARSESILKTYQGEWASGDKAETQGKTEAAVKEVAKMNLVGARPFDRFIGKDNIVYVLVALDQEKAKESIMNNNKLSAEMKATIDKHSSELFTELSEGK